MAKDAAPERKADTPSTETDGKRRDGTRETIESIVIAFIFAFLFRTFEAEAFVIPTGSMAPTLLGRHKDEACPACGFEFTVGASEEINQETGMLQSRFTSAICPNCRNPLEIRQDPAFVGDRILVTKFNYRLNDPNRWDVTVFKYPEDPSTNYIKRMCGLPGETIEIRQGDLYSMQEGKAEILRKPDFEKQSAVLQTVYDDNHPPRSLLETGWPERWAAVAHDGGPDAVDDWSVEVDGWQPDTENRTYALKSTNERHWLRYRHFVPNDDDWTNSNFSNDQPSPELILDIIGYDTSGPTIGGFFDRGVYWVGDLALSATINLRETQADGKIILELNEGDRKYRCILDPNAGEARLTLLDSMDRDVEESSARLISTAPIDLTEPGEYEIHFANIDDRLWLTIDGEEIEFETPAYMPFMGQLFLQPTNADLTPVGIAAEHVDLEVSDLVIKRDIYYRAEFAAPNSFHAQHRNPRYLQEVGDEEAERHLHELATTPREYGEFYANKVSWTDDTARRARWLPLNDDEFLLLGDNSPRSLDGRMWPNARMAEHRHAVHRDALVGKALLIFWPHGLRIGNEKNGQPHGWTLPFLDSFFYHKQVGVGRDGNPRTELVEDYPAHGVPFYPDFERILQRIR